MTAAEIAATGLSEVDQRSQLRRAVVASTIATTILLQWRRARLPVGVDHRLRTGPVYFGAVFAAFQTGCAIAFYILGCGIISIIAALLLKDHTNKNIDEVDVSPL